MKQLASLMVLCTISADCFSRNYPETREERDLRETGSIFGPEGLVVRPFKKEVKKKTQDQNKENAINKYLWQAAIQSLDFIPIISADIQSGIVITDWHVSQDLKRRTKVVVIIKQNTSTIDLNAIKVRVHSQVLKGRLWVSDVPNGTMKTIIENDIIRKARELFLKK